MKNFLHCALGDGYLESDVILKCEIVHFYKNLFSQLIQLVRND